MTSGFASTKDLADKTISFDELGPGLFGYTAEGDPNSGVVVGDDSVLVVDAQATPAMAADVIARIRTVTDKPVKPRRAQPLPCGAGAGRERLCKGAEIIASDVDAHHDRRAWAAGHGQRDRPLPPAVPRAGRHPRAHVADHSRSMGG